MEQISLWASNQGQEFNSDAALALIEQFDTNNLGEVLTVTTVTRAMIREYYQQAHTLLVMITLGAKVKPFA
jgi:hypothetical protein